MNLTGDGIPVTVPPGASALDAINTAGVPISRLCQDADLPATGVCRTCPVQIDGGRGFPASCSVPAAEGMAIRTDTEDARRIRAGVIELTLGMVGAQSANGAGAGVGGYGQLSTAAARHGVTGRRWPPRSRQAADTSNPVFNLAMDACILCARCVNACQDSHQFIGAIGVLGAGRTARIAAAGDLPLADSICTTCGQCLSVCPTGAIASKKRRPRQPVPSAPPVPTAAWAVASNWKWTTLPDASQPRTMTRIICPAWGCCASRGGSGTPMFSTPTASKRR